MSKTLLVERDVALHLIIRLSHLSYHPLFIKAPTDY